MRNKKSLRATISSVSLPLWPTSLAAGTGVVLAALLFSGAAEAGDLSYSPINPAFGGSPLNSSYLNSSADAQNKPKKLDQKRTEAKSTDPQLQFTSTLQSRLLSAVSDKISNAIYGDNPANSGTFVVNNTTISFNRVGSNVQLTLSDGIKTTNITIPAN